MTEMFTDVLRRAGASAAGRHASRRRAPPRWWPVSARRSARRAERLGRSGRAVAGLFRRTARQLGAPFRPRKQPSCAGHPPPSPHRSHRRAQPPGDVGETSTTSRRLSVHHARGLRVRARCVPRTVALAQQRGPARPAADEQPPRLRSSATKAQQNVSDLLLLRWTGAPDLVTSDQDAVYRADSHWWNQRRLSSPVLRYSGTRFCVSGVAACSTNSTRPACCRAPERAPPGH